MEVLTIKEGIFVKGSIVPLRTLWWCEERRSLEQSVRC